MYIAGLSAASYDLYDVDEELLCTVNHGIYNDRCVERHSVRNNSNSNLNISYKKSARRLLQRAIDMRTAGSTYDCICQFSVYMY